MDATGFPTTLKDAPALVPASVMQMLSAYRAIPVEGDFRKAFDAIGREISAAKLRGAFAEAEATRLVLAAVSQEARLKFTLEADQSSPYSVPNTYPVGHPTRDAYERQMAERAALVAKVTVFLDSMQNLAAVDAALMKA